MFLKSVKNIFSKNRSITTRLTFFYAIATFILLMLIALFLYWSLVNTLYQNDKQFLSDEVDIVHYLLEHHAQPTILEHEINITPFLLSNSFYHYYIRVLNKKNQIVYETPGMEMLNQAVFSHKKNLWWYSKNGDKYLLMQSFTHTNWVIQAALSVSYQHEVVEQYRQRAITILIVGEIFAIFIGFIIARKGLRRLYELTNMTKNITASSLHQRVDANAWPKELRKLARAFNEMLNRIEVAFSHLTQFSDDLAHELRTPINNLMGQTEIALSCPATIKEYQQTLEANLEDLQRLSQIIENLLYLARTENPQREIKKNILQVPEEISVVCDFYQAMADDKKIKVTCEGKGIVLANQVMFRRLISNLLSNALKHTPSGGEVKFFIKEIGKNIEIRLCDNGAGIAAEHLPKIFNRFYRVDAARSQTLGSTGLGLAIVKSIVDLHHGTITIQSKVSQGTIIVLNLPLSP